MKDMSTKRSWIGILPVGTDIFFLWSILLLTIIFWLFFLPNFISAANKYYYIHVGSFRAKRNAVQTAEKLQKKGYGGLVRGEEVPKLGYWYRIYVGPFFSLKEAKLKSDEVKRRGLTKYTAIYAKDSPIRGDLPKEVRGEKEAVAAAPMAKRKTKVSVARAPVSPQPQKQPTVKAKKAPAPVVSKPAPPPPAKPKARVKVKPREPQSARQRQGLGRNVGGGNFSLAYQHTYREVKTEVTDRKSTTVNGGVTVTDVAVSGSEKNKFDTEMHLDIVRLGFGVADFLELFGDIGICYDDPTDINLAYGGGARLNVFELENGSFKGFYTALQGEYHKGKLETDYQSVAGNKFSKEADWWEFVGKGEVGLTRKRFSLYVGGTYLLYREDTERKQLENIPLPFTSVKFEDDLEEENNFGAYGGLSLHLTPGLLINVEGQILTQNAVAGMIQYRF